MTADIPQELSMDSNNDVEPSDTYESNYFFKINSKSDGVEGETINQPSRPTGRQILMKSICLQNHAPLQDGQHVVTKATTVKFISLKRVMSIAISV